MKLNRHFRLSLIILAVGLAITLILVFTKSKAQRKKEEPDKTALVRVLEIRPESRPLVIRAFSSTQAAKELNISPQVGGQVVEISPVMTEGGRAKKGEVLFKIDPADYQLRVLQAQAGMATAEYNLDSALAQQKSAQKGLESFKKVQGESPEGEMQVSTLAMYGPQIKNAKAAMASAQAALRQAELNLERTQVRAPFDGFFRSVNLAEGQVVNPGQGVASFFAQSPVQLLVTLPLAELPWVQAQGESGKGARAILAKQIGQQLHQWEGQVTHRLLEIDSLGHMAQVVVEVQDTLSNRGFPLPIGMQVEVQIQGEEMSETIAVPLYALRSNNHAWVVSPDNRLVVVPLEILRKDKGQALIASGLKPGDLLITSPLENPLPGMKLRIYRPQSGESDPQPKVPAEAKEMP